MQDKQLLEKAEIGSYIYMELQREPINTLNPQQKSLMISNRFKFFADSFPLVVKLMCINNVYDERAFLNYMKYLLRKNTEGMNSMDRYIENQCDYIKFLYPELWKREGKHVDNKELGLLWDRERVSLKRFVKKIEDEERLNKSEYEELEHIFDIQRRSELLEFVNKNS
jgi:hypothetical protein